MRSYKSVLRILSRSGDGLQPLMERAHYLQGLTQRLRAVVDNDLAQHITVANLRENTVIITADSPVWLARVRYLAPILLQQIQRDKELETIQKIQFKVQPLDDARQPFTPTRHASLSARSSDIISSAASGIHHPDLSAALNRLSQRGRKKPSENNG